MTQGQERQEIFKALKDYEEKHNAAYYCVILTPTDDREASIYGNITRTPGFGKGAGKIISDVVDKEIFFRPLKRK